MSEIKNAQYLEVDDNGNIVGCGNDTDYDTHSTDVQSSTNLCRKLVVMLHLQDCEAIVYQTFYWNSGEK